MNPDLSISKLIIKMNFITKLEEFNFPHFFFLSKLCFVLLYKESIYQDHQGHWRNRYDQYFIGVIRWEYGPLPIGPKEIEDQPR